MIRTLSDEMKEKFGGKVYKLALDGGFTCPNRDGTCGTSGCIFCLGGSGSFAERKTGDVWEQIERAKALVEKKNPSGRYIAYFQSYTATYAPLEKLEALFSRAISHPDIVGLSVATRPDCLPDDVIALLRRLNEQKPVWVELGLQTTDEKTAAYIRRGYPLSVYDDAVSRLKAAGLTVIVHLILGLPGESIETMAQSARYVGKSGADGVKAMVKNSRKLPSKVPKLTPRVKPVTSEPNEISSASASTAITAMNQTRETSSFDQSSPWTLTGRVNMR